MSHCWDRSLDNVGANTVTALPQCWSVNWALRTSCAEIWDGWSTFLLGFSNEFHDCAGAAHVWDGHDADYFLIPGAEPCFEGQRS